MSYAQTSDVACTKCRFFDESVIEPMAVADLLVTENTPWPSQIHKRLRMASYRRRTKKKRDRKITEVR